MTRLARTKSSPSKPTTARASAQRIEQPRPKASSATAFRCTCALLSHSRLIFDWNQRIRGRRPSVWGQRLTTTPPFSPSTRTAAAESDDTSTSAVVVEDAPTTSDVIPSLLPGAEEAAAANNVGVTTLDPSSLPALDAAVSLRTEDEREELLLLLPPLGGASAPASSSSIPSPPLSPGFLTPAVRGMVAINLGAVLFGSNMVAVKLAQSDGTSPAATSAGRFAIAALVFLPSAIKVFQSSSSTSSTSLSSSLSSLLKKSGLELGMWLFAGYTGQAIGLSMTSASRGAFSSAFTVLAVPLLQAALGDGRGRKTKVPTSTWVAAAAAVAGVFLLTADGGSGGKEAATAAAGANLGDLLCVLSAVAFGVHKWRSEQIVESLSRSSSSPSTASSNNNNEETVRSLVALQLCVLALASCALCLPEAAGALSKALSDSAIVAGAASPSPSSSCSAVFGALFNDLASLPWPLFLYMGLFTTAWTIDSEAKALRHVSSATAALIYSGEPLWGSLLAAACLGERFEGVSGWVGAALVVGASLVSQFGAAAGKSGGGRGGEAETE